MYLRTVSGAFRCRCCCTYFLVFSGFSFVIETDLERDLVENFANKNISFGFERDHSDLSF